MVNIQGRKGGGGNAQSPKESPDSLHSVATAKILLALGEGECAGGLTDKDIYLDGTPVRAQDGTLNFPGVTWEYRPGTQAQEYIQGIPSVENEISINTPLKQTQPWTRAISNTQLSALRIRLGLPALQKQKDNGDVVGSRVEYKIELAIDGGAYQVVVNGAFDGKTTSLYERSHRIDLPKATTGWQVRVTRITADSVSNRLADATNIEAYAEVIDAKLRYPNTELLFVTFDAKQFSSIPQISVKAPGRLIRVPATYDPVARTYSGTWDGSFKWAYSNNPAWVFYDMVLNPRFGLGDRLDATQVDKWELYRIAQYCDQLVPDGLGGSGTEPRFLCDVYIQSQNEAFNVLRDLASIFRGMTYWANNQLFTLADQPRDMTYIFTRANVIGGKFVYAGGSERNRYSTAMVSWSNPDNHYSDEVEAVVEQGLVRRYGVRQTEITAIGCVRRTEANRRGRWVLLTNAKDRLVTFSTGLEGMIPLPGHIIGVADQNLSGKVMGGRISAVNGRVITLDRIADVKAGNRLILNLPSGVSQARTVQVVNDRQVTVTTAYSETPEVQAVWSVDADDLFIQQYRVTSVTDNDDATFTIAAINHNPDKYAAIDTGARLDERPISAIPPGVQAPPAAVTITSYSRVVQNISVETLRVNWDAVPNAIAYECEWRKDNGDWVNAPRTSSLGFEVPGIYSGRYTARVRAINSSDISSIWTVSPEVELKGKVGLPPKPLGLSATEDVVFGINISWGFPADAGDTLNTEIQYSMTADGANPMLLADVPYPQKIYQQMGLKAGQEFWYSARLIDRTGNQSDWTDWVGGQASIDVSDIIDAVFDQIKDSDAYKELTADIKELSDKDIQIDAAIVKEVDDRVKGDQAEAAARAQALIDEKNARVADITTVNTLVQDTADSLAQQIAQVSAGTGDQFDSLNIWYFDNSSDGWTTGAGTAVSVSNGWAKSSDALMVSPVLTMPGSSYRYVKGRIKKTGTSNTSTFKLEWKQGAETAFVHSVNIDLPVFDAKGIGTIAIADIPWTDVKQFRFVSSVAPSSTDFIEVDWFAVGRPTPGAGMAALQTETTARVKGDSAEAAERTLLATQMRGNYAGNDLSFVSSGLLAAEKTARSDADEAEVKARTALQTDYNSNKASVSQTLTTLSNAQSSQASLISGLNTSVGNNAASIQNALISELSNAVGNNKDFKQQLLQVGISRASITRLDETIATNEEATAKTYLELAAKTRDNAASIAQVNSAVTSLEKSTASSIQLVTASINGVDVKADGISKNLSTTSATVQTHSSAIAGINNKLSAQWGVKVETLTGGKKVVGGIQLGVDGEGGESSFLINANTFAIFNPVNGGEQLVFVVKNGQTFIPSGFLEDGSITNAKIGNNIQSNNYAWNNGDFTGWYIGKDGTALLSNVTVKGKVIATSGSFTGDVYANNGWFKGTVYAEKIEGDVSSTTAVPLGSDSSESGTYTVNYAGGMPFVVRLIIPFINLRGYVSTTSGLMRFRVLINGSPILGLGSDASGWFSATVTSSTQSVVDRFVSGYVDVPARAANVPIQIQWQKYTGGNYSGNLSWSPFTIIASPMKNNRFTF